MSADTSIQARMGALRGKLLAAAALLAAASGFAWFVHPDLFFPAYLIGYIFCIGITLGSLFFLMIHHLVGGRWGFALRRVLEAATRTLPLMALLFLPILAGLPTLYAWVGEQAAHDELIQAKAWYLNVPGFITRAVVCFAVWGLLVFLLNRWSARQDETGDPLLNRPLRMWSGPGVVLYVLTVTVAAWDWGMSLDPHWFSSLYGPWFLVSQGLTTLAFGILALAALSRFSPMNEIARPKVFHDIGNLTFAFVILWAYMTFSQFLIIWSGNLPEETPYYLARIDGGWSTIAALLTLFHFLLPVILLLIRFNKLRPRILSAIAWLILVMRFVDLYWAVYPAFSPGKVHVHWILFVVPAALVAVFVWYFLGQLRARPLVPLHDPRFEAAPDLNKAVSHE